MEAEPLADSASTESGLSPGKLNGVFKGGGAKGVVYAGALEAVHDYDLHFVSVAGSSAGAITAALVAADLDTSQRRLVMPVDVWTSRAVCGTRARSGTDRKISPSLDFRTLYRGSVGSADAAED